MKKRRRKSRLLNFHLRAYADIFIMLKLGISVIAKIFGTEKKRKNVLERKQQEKK